MNNQETLASIIIIVSCICLFLPTIKYKPNTIITILCFIFFSLLSFIFYTQNLMSWASLILMASLILILINLIYICIIISSHKERIQDQDVTFRYDNSIIITFSIIAFECFVFLMMAKFFTSTLSSVFFLSIIFFLSVLLFILSYLNNLYLEEYTADG